jgi:hypothetical protein
MTAKERTLWEQAVRVLQRNTITIEPGRLGTWVRLSRSALGRGTKAWRT